VFTFFAAGQVEKVGVAANEKLSKAADSAPFGDEPTVCGYLELKPQSQGAILVTHLVTGRTWTIHPTLEKLSTSAPKKMEQILLKILREEFGVERKLRPKNRPSEKPEEAVEEPALGSTYAEQHHELEPPEQEASPIETPAASPPTEITMAEGTTHEFTLAGLNDAESTISMPFALKPREEKILKLFAKHGQLSDKSLSKSLKTRRTRSTMEHFINKLQRAGIPLIVNKGDGGGDGRLYGFDYQVMERLHSS
jgi:predicted transcriptional regulator